MLVRDVLVSKGSSTVFTISPDATVLELLDLMADHNIGALPVSEDGATLIGMVSERDVVRKLRHLPHPRDAHVRDIMTTDLHTCGPEASFADLMTTMTQNRVRHIPVIDDGRLVGLLSIGDAVKYRTDQLEFERDQLTNYVSG